MAEFAFQKWGHESGGLLPSMAMLPLMLPWLLGHICASSWVMVPECTQLWRQSLEFPATWAVEGPEFWETLLKISPLYFDTFIVRMCCCQPDFQ